MTKPTKPENIDKAAMYFPEIAGKMTPERAELIRLLRVEGCSWRSVAARTSVDWGGDYCWKPKSNQLAGTDLCYVAALYFGEDCSEEPWN